MGFVTSLLSGGFSLVSGFSLRTWGLIAGGIALFGVLVGGYLFITGLVNDKARLSAELATQKLETQIANATRDHISREHDKIVERVEELDQARAANAAEIAELRSQLADLNTEEEIQNDPPRAARNFAARSHALNRLLEQLSAGHRGDRARPHK